MPVSPQRPVAQQGCRTHRSGAELTRDRVDGVLRIPPGLVLVPQPERRDGAPGVYSARWAGPERDFKVAMQELADRVRERGGWAQAPGQPGPRANFTAVLCLAWPDGAAQAFEGRVWGHLVWPPRGDKGFGYDPVFVPTGYAQSFAELDPAEKHRISHRADAFAKLVADQF